MHNLHYQPNIILDQRIIESHTWWKTLLFYGATSVFYHLLSLSFPWMNQNLSATGEFTVLQIREVEDNKIVSMEGPTPI